MSTISEKIRAQQMAFYHKPTQQWHRHLVAPSELAHLIAEASLCEQFKLHLSEVMPPDSKDWWHNPQSEWPRVAKNTILALRRTEELARSMLNNNDENNSESA